MRSYRPRGTVRRTRQVPRGARRACADRPSPHGLQPARQWRRVAAAAVAAALPRLRREPCRSPAASRRKPTRVLGTFLRDVMKLNLAKQNFRLFGPDETASNRLEAVYRSHRQGMDGRGRRGRHRSQRRRPRHGGAERASVRRLARRLPAHRTPRPVLLLRGLHPHHRFDVQPACQMAEGQHAAFPGASRSPR